jgi:hypothetical protein
VLFSNKNKFHFNYISPKRYSTTHYNYSINTDNIYDTFILIMHKKMLLLIVLILYHIISRIIQDRNMTSL